MTWNCSHHHSQDILKKNPIQILSPRTYNDHGMKNLEIGFCKKPLIFVTSVLGTIERQKATYLSMDFYGINVLGHVLGHALKHRCTDNLRPYLLM